MKRSRAFTLIEALAATALLAVVAVACMPVLQSAARIAKDPAAAVDPGALAALADRIAAEPEQFGLAEPAKQVSVLWPEDLGSGTEPASAVLYIDAEAGDRWVVAACSTRTALRWLPPPKDWKQPRRPRRGRSRARRAQRSNAELRCHRGISLIETLVALAVTAMLSVAVIGWTVSTAQVAAKAERSARAASAAESTLRLIAEDLATGDFAVETKAARGSDARTPPHAEVEGSSLVVRGRRSGGATVRRYTFDHARSSIVAVDSASDHADARDADRRTVASGVTEFTLREEGPRSGPKWLAVTIALDGADAVTRRMALP